MNKKTLYILGAGFSKHFGLPLAGELKSEVFDNPDCRAAWNKFISVPSIVDEAFKVYRCYEKKLSCGAEEFWMHIKNEEAKKEAQENHHRSPAFWLARFFPFAISEFFYKKIESVSLMPDAYTNFFKNLYRGRTQNDALLYMNWDIIPELYCGFSYTNTFCAKSRPLCAPVSAGSLGTAVKKCGGAIPVYRPAGGLHLYAIPLDASIKTPPNKCFQLTKNPNIYCARLIDTKFWGDLRTQVGDSWNNENNEEKNLNFMIFPGVDPSQEPWVQGQLREAANELKASNRVVVIGYRFPEYDVHMRNWLEGQTWQKKEIVVVNPEPETFKYLKTSCKGAVVKAESCNFEDSSFAKP